MAKKAQKSFRYSGNKKALTATLLAITVLGVLLFLWFRLDYIQIKRQVNTLHIPDGWSLLKDRETGNHLCLDSCPGYVKIYRVNANRESLNSVFASVLAKSGYIILEQDADCSTLDEYEISYCYATGKKDNIAVTISLKPGEKISNIPLQGKELIEIFSKRD